MNAVRHVKSDLKRVIARSETLFIDGGIVYTCGARNDRSGRAEQNQGEAMAVSMPAQTTHLIVIRTQNVIFFHRYISHLH